MPTPTQPTAPDAEPIPGPWFTQPNRDDAIFVCSKEHGRIAMLYYPTGKRDARMVATASLIAAAPEAAKTNARLTEQNAALVKALEEVERRCPGHLSGLLDIARAALAQSRTT